LIGRRKGACSDRAKRAPGEIDEAQIIHPDLKIGDDITFRNRHRAFKLGR